MVLNRPTYKGNKMSAVLNTPEQIQKFKLLSLESALGLEIKGIKFRSSINTIVCEMLGLPVGTKRAVTLAYLKHHIANL